MHTVTIQFFCLIFSRYKRFFIEYQKTMSLKLGDEFPNFALKTTAGNFQLHDWLGERSV
jgi:hypothetical protein